MGFQNAFDDFITLNNNDTSNLMDNAVHEDDLIQFDDLDIFEDPNFDIYNPDYDFVGHNNENNSGSTKVKPSDSVVTPLFNNPKIENIIRTPTLEPEDLRSAHIFNTPATIILNSPQSANSTIKEMSSIPTPNVQESVVNHHSNWSDPKSNALHHMTLLTNLVKENTKQKQELNHTVKALIDSPIKLQDEMSTPDSFTPSQIFNAIPDVTPETTIESLNSSTHFPSSLPVQGHVIPQFAKRKQSSSSKKRRKIVNKNINAKYDKDLTGHVKNNKIFPMSSSYMLTPCSPAGYKTYNRTTTSLVDEIRSDAFINPIAMKKQKRGSYRCNHCPEMFSTILQYAEHMDRFGIRRKYHCPFIDCPWKILGLPGRSDLRRHCAIQHKDQLSPELRSSLNLKDDVYVTTRCPNKYCGKSFRRKDAYNRHIAIVHNRPDSRFNKRLAVILRQCPETFQNDNQKTRYITTEMGRKKK
ncbi:Rme1 protein [Maudiozyma humilis]|uniref:Rme1 protein n=1 Tax=Maudiozyma humilis TaxID=51915 RepID=A0AAV5RRB6_MAUHU|nr:Rme1 protein [Kazachstania humilis]